MVEDINTYCTYVKDLDTENVHKRYHDHEYGFPIRGDNLLFALLMLECNQAGLSWELILKKKDNFFKAYDNFDIDVVAAYTEEDVERLKNDAGIIRNRLKIQAAIYNAQAIQKLQGEFGSFEAWLDKQGEMELDQWVKLFKKHFKFTGKEVTNEFLMSSSYLPGAHSTTCAIYPKVLSSNPKWNRF